MRPFILLRTFGSAAQVNKLTNKRRSVFDPTVSPRSTKTACTGNILANVPQPHPENNETEYTSENRDPRKWIRAWMRAVRRPETALGERKRRTTYEQRDQNHREPDGYGTEFQPTRLRTSILDDLAYSRRIDVRVWLCIVCASLYRDKVCRVTFVDLKLRTWKA